ncbi:unnamed protein product, partial [Urochloa humidicola]
VLVIPRRCSKPHTTDFVAYELVVGEQQQPQKEPHAARRPGPRSEGPKA